jgi:hypothetical protein
VDELVHTICECGTANHPKNEISDAHMERSFDGAACPRVVNLVAEQSQDVLVLIAYFGSNRD